jgi:serine acetyltransferase
MEMITRYRAAVEQLSFLAADMRLQVEGHWWRWLSIWFSRSFVVLANYRLSRAGFLLFGRLWGPLRLLLSPLCFLLGPWLGGAEIHYRAVIGPGLIILHPGLGTVISAYTEAGQRLSLAGGNVIGGRHPLLTGDLVLGDRVSLGVNAVVLGPVHIGNDVRIGAGAVVIRDAADGQVLVGVPAQPVPARSEGIRADALYQRQEGPRNDEYLPVVGALTNGTSIPEAPLDGQEAPADPNCFELWAL